MRKTKRTEGSPYRKAAMAPTHFKIVPRRSRALLFALFCLFVFLLLPSSDFDLRGVLLFLLFSTDPGRSHGSAGQAVDILQFIDPLIGTANGGHVFPGASLPYGRSAGASPLVVWR
ncbi:hypothetical protein B0T26DRAFT_408095 [Lasiosphaeria miniovina]|uniref:Uncharacterized protein n=1 Tax=Lasiosphaeria miniovina TaxID=1954250 RepID=A0AA40A584_9PEZI|nr:uncharacterized protein B0T26DRAFT_408095 [Lasiosphaeria miniovina]KAK0709497.1 hypothetical protein B0T26DRAFT_408095 [Lasiosphaeria miniovina]